MSGGTGARLRVGTSNGGFQYVDITPTGTATVYERFFTALSATAYVTFFGQGDGVNTITVDNVSVKEAVPDRSYKAQGALVYGTLTKSVVAPGAQLVAYSGFSS